MGIVHDRLETSTGTSPRNGRSRLGFGRYFVFPAPNVVMESIIEAPNRSRPMPVEVPDPADRVENSRIDSATTFGAGKTKHRPNPSPEHPFPSELPVQTRSRLFSGEVPLDRTSGRAWTWASERELSADPIAPISGRSSEWSNFAPAMGDPQYRHPTESYPPDTAKIDSGSTRVRLRADEGSMGSLCRLLLLVACTSSSRKAPCFVLTPTCHGHNRRHKQGSPAACKRKPATRAASTRGHKRGGHAMSVPWV